MIRLKGLRRGRRVKRWLRGVTYKPGWSVQFGGALKAGTFIVVQATEPDVRDPSVAFHTSPLFRVPEAITTRQQFLDWVLDTAIPGVEQHERYEWFRVKGKHHCDPHAPGMPAFATEFPVTS